MSTYYVGSSGPFYNNREGGGSAVIDEGASEFLLAPTSVLTDVTATPIYEEDEEGNPVQVGCMVSRSYTTIQVANPMYKPSAFPAAEAVPGFKRFYVGSSGPFLYEDNVMPSDYTGTALARHSVLHTAGDEFLIPSLNARNPFRGK